METIIFLSHARRPTPDRRFAGRRERLPGPLPCARAPAQSRPVSQLARRYGDWPA
ncbi:hypothetical protein Ga0061061_106281 [Chelatococcus sambhunathii]|uniref:Histidine phosphatase family protein n=1 Tax=Chelatococcus sambhunathii TaxID=363953 RepID=A0ABP2A5H6_9HYPH|nr:hypothetical protein [Chelatococcus sp. XZ-Ab1]CUA89183.1 hypothetical protein Ga0061061_106281 [Chelatococcus sambhunathii]